MKIGLVVCWYGEFPDYFSVWLKSCEKNNNIDYLVFTDASYTESVPQNVKLINLPFPEMVSRTKSVLGFQVSLAKPYRICDFRPMFGLIFENELKIYDFWGYCDIDLVFGNIQVFLSEININEMDAVFNRGHFTLIKNSDKMNNLFKCRGALFNYKTVARHDAIFAFDENTGIQKIAKAEGIRAVYTVPYIDADGKYKQLRSRFEKDNPSHQVFYWENGILYRAKCVDDKCYIQETMYIHLQKRELVIRDRDVLASNAFWIEPNGFSTKSYLGYPKKEDIERYNPKSSEEEMKKQVKEYRSAKLKTILGRNLYQIFVRIKQQFAGINSDDGTKDSGLWERY